MKRLLMATTALCLGAGTAAADVALSGSAEMGVAGSKDDSARFHTDVNVKFGLSGTTDGGITFGSAIELAESGDGSPAVDDDDEHGGISVFMKGPFGNVEMGDTDGAYDWALAEIVGVGGGAIRDDHEHGAYDGNGGLDGKHDGQILRYDIAIGSGFEFGASVELSDDKDGQPGGKTYDPIFGAGGKFSMPMNFGNLALGGGFQMGSFDHAIMDGHPDPADATKKRTIWGSGGPVAGHDGEVEGAIFGGSAKLDVGGADSGGSWHVIANGSLMEADGSVTHGPAAARVTTTADVEATYLGIGLGYAVGDLSMGVNFANKVTESTVDPNNRANADSTVLETTVNGVGFTAAYGLGGGAEIQFGVGSSETENDYTYNGRPAALSGSGEGGHDSSSDTNKWSLGVAFSF